MGEDREADVGRRVSKTKQLLHWSGTILVG